MAIAGQKVHKAGKKTGFTASLLKSARAALGSVVLPADLSDQQIHDRFGKKLINVNVNALVHIQLATKVLEYLVSRRVINFGENTDKTDVANQIIKKNKAFVDKLTQNHEKGVVNDFDEFSSEVQERVEETATKLMAILMTGDRRLGNADSELAAPVHYSVKVVISLTIDDLLKLFGRENPIKEKCDSYIAKEVDQEQLEGFEDFFNFLKAHIKQGNGTRSYKFLRIASASVFSLSRSGNGIDTVQGQVNDSIVQSGKPLESEEIDFSDLPSFEEEYENLNCLFNDEELRLTTHGGAFVALAAAGLAYMKELFEPTPEVRARIEALFAAGISTANLSPAERDIAKATAGQEGYEKLRVDLEVVARGFVDGHDGRSQDERLRAARPHIVKVADLLGTFATSDRISNEGRLRMERGLLVNDEEKSINEQHVEELTQLAENLDKLSKEFVDTYEPTQSKLDDNQQRQVRAFCLHLSGLLDAIAGDGFVAISDRTIPPTENRIPFFQNYVGLIDQLKRSIRDDQNDKTLSTKAPEDSGLSANDMFDLAKKLSQFLNNASFHTAAKAP